MEHAGDMVDRSLLGIANKMVKRGVTFSKAGQAELLTMIDRLMANVRMAASLFMTGDERAARLLAAEKEVFRNLELAATDAHFARFRAGGVRVGGDQQHAPGCGAGPQEHQRVSGGGRRLSHPGAPRGAPGHPSAGT